METVGTVTTCSSIASVGDLIVMEMETDDTVTISMAIRWLAISLMSDTGPVVFSDGVVMVLVTGVGHGAAGDLGHGDKEDDTTGKAGDFTRNPSSQFVRDCCRDCFLSSLFVTVRLVAARAVMPFIIGGNAFPTEVARAGERFHEFDDRGVATAFVLESRRPTKWRSITTLTLV
ncbi:hypothetical protein TIFTF001_016086 [Ficus carica]|uniref:Uncharacterized protein n=1 Tax=Ficus carica TaxID=3494 RepID=A0AA88D745_FICCA|nr:hypothetical protein TIFTF001_016086 [Ficus carica]